MSLYKVYQRKARGTIDKPLEKELKRECSWVPGTPAKLLSLGTTSSPLEKNPVNGNPEEGKASNGTGTGDQCFYSSLLIDLNKGCDEWQNFPGGLNEGLDEVEGQFSEIPFTHLLNSYNVVSPDSQESVISTTQHAVVDKTTSDPQIGIPRSPDASDSQVSASSVMASQVDRRNCVLQTPENRQKDTNNAENLQTDHNITTENLNKQSEKKRKTQQKPKRKIHRPRVAVEGAKPKKVLQPKTPKPATPKWPSSKQTAPSNKRKRNYGRKSSHGNSVSENTIDEALPKRRKSSRKTKKTTCKRGLSFDLETQSIDESAVTAAAVDDLRALDECLDTSEQCEQYFPKVCRRTRSQRRRRLNTLFMPKLTLGQAGMPRKKKSSRSLIRKSDLALLIAPPICNQLPRLSFEIAQTEPEKIMLTDYCHEWKTMEDMRNLELGPEDLELENEIFLFTARDRGLQEALQEQHIDSVNQDVHPEPKYLQEERYDSDIEKGPPGFEDIWLIRKSRGSQKVLKEKKEMVSITKKLKLLRINDRDSKSKKKGLNAKDPNGALVPYQDLAVRNSKRITGKVELDPDTLRVWNQLMNINDGDATKEKTDPEKEERWRRERDVFQGRIQSFTARMHLILGDRRFKPWKGSVVDSVVGVYLTQNVSDNLSSSAYMSLAAKFPVKTTSDSAANSMASTGDAAYEFEGNLYFVTEPETNRSSKLKNRIENPDSGIEGSSNNCSPGSCSCTNELLPMLENTTWLQDLEYNGGKISSCGNQASTIDSYDPFELQARYGNGALTSGRVNESNVDHGFISLQSDSHDQFGLSICSSNLEGSRSHMQQAQDTSTVMSTKTWRGQSPTLKSDDKAKKAIPKEKKKDGQEQKDWELFRKMYSSGKQTSSDQMDSVDWEAVRLAEPGVVAKAIKYRGQHNIIAGRIQDCLNRLVKVHNGIDLEWLRNAPPEIVKEYLLEIPGLGLKSVECVRLLSLHHNAFPVDTNVGRIAVRLGWVPLQPLPESLQIHLLEQYPLMDSIQKYLWPRLCNLDQRTLYELHYQLITFGKVFCTKRNPNCGVCPLRGECKHFASAFGSVRLALPGPPEKGIVKIPNWLKRNPPVDVNTIPVTLLEVNPVSEPGDPTHNNWEPIIEEPTSPEPQIPEISPESDLEDFDFGGEELEDDNIPTIRLQEREFKENLQSFMETNNIVLQDSRALVVMAAEAASMPAPKLKSINRLRTEHLVYILPDNHRLLRGFERREAYDTCPYLLSIWTPGETSDSFEKPITKCSSGDSDLCNEQTCYSCSTIREQNADIVRGTILIPCRTANRGRFPLNGTYFQVNEVFADHETSLHPIDVPRSMIAELPRQTAYFGTSATSIFRALDLPGIQQCFWRGYICVRGFDRKSRAPRPLARRFHTPPSKMGKQSGGKWSDDE